jgi:hypothetical protein
MGHDYYLLFDFGVHIPRRSLEFGVYPVRKNYVGNYCTGRSMCEERRCMKWQHQILNSAYIHSYITYIHVCIHTYIYTYICTYINTYIHLNIHTYIHTCMHTYIHVCIHTHIHTYMYALRNTAYIKIYVCACVHKYTCTYLYVLHNLGSELQLVETQWIGRQELLANECGRVIARSVIHWR